MIRRVQEFARGVRTEFGMIIWPPRQEAIVATGFVLATVAVSALFFFIVDQMIAMGVRSLLGVGG